VGRPRSHKRRLELFHDLSQLVAGRSLGRGRTDAQIPTIYLSIGAAQEVAARTVVARGRVGRRVGEWQRRVGPGEGDSPQVRVPLGRASGPGVRPVGPSSRPRAPVGPSRPCVGPTECPLGPKPPRLGHARGATRPLFCPTRPLFCPTRPLFCPTRTPSIEPATRGSALFWPGPTF
jgi:hypothetical protein